MAFFRSLLLIVALFSCAALTATPGTVSAGTSGQDGTAAALLAKHRAYIGWQFGDGTFSSMRISGSVTDEKGKKTVNFTMLMHGLLYRETYTLLDRSGVKEDTGFTGNLFWRSNINGFTNPIYGDEAKYLATFTLLLEEGTTELPATFVKNETLDGKPVSVVRVTLSRGYAIDCYVDPATGAYVQAVIDPGGSYETTMHILSYRDVASGKRMIGSYRFDELKDVHSYDTVEPNAQISDADLHPPSPTAYWTFENGDPANLTLTHDRILVDASVNGVKGRFILDTGASAIFLNNAFANRVKAAITGDSEAMSIVGTVKTNVRKTSTISVGGATLHNALVYSEDFASDDYRGLDRAGYDGLMGYDLFADSVVKMDVYASKLTVLDASSDESATRGLQLLVDLADGTPAIPMTLNKSIGVNAWLDTGNPGIVLMSSDFAKKRHLTLARVGCEPINSLTIGPITYAGQMVCTWDFPSNYMLLGFDFLKHFDYVFDYPQGRLYMSPNANK